MNERMMNSCTPRGSHAISGIQREGLCCDPVMVVLALIIKKVDDTGECISGEYIFSVDLPCIIQLG
mgnify:CR=1 FL=1